VKETKFTNSGQDVNFEGVEAPKRPHLITNLVMNVCTLQIEGREPIIILQPETEYVKKVGENETQKSKQKRGKQNCVIFRF
jgi:hypothetical protein